MGDETVSMWARRRQLSHAARPTNRSKVEVIHSDGEKPGCIGGQASGELILGTQSARSHDGWPWAGGRVVGVVIGVEKEWVEMVSGLGGGGSGIFEKKQISGAQADEGEEGQGQEREGEGAKAAEHKARGTRPETRPRNTFTHIFLPFPCRACQASQISSQIAREKHARAQVAGAGLAVPAGVEDGRGRKTD